jgi:hypothetical protein
MKLLRIAVLVVIICVTLKPSFAKDPPEIPDSLKPWVDWVLHDHEEEYLCIPQHNDRSQLRCSWPTELTLSLNDKGGTFAQQWFVKYESWITLPGNDLHWPQNVRVNNKPVVVLKKDGQPKIKFQKGIYEIKGDLNWNRLPEHLKIPSDSALVSLLINDKRIDFPNIDDQGRLWLQARMDIEEKIENRLNIQSFRMIDDRIPPRIVLFMNLDVAGSAREIILGPAFSPEKFIPVSLESSLPARVEQDGRIRMQIRPGQWTLNLTVRHTGPIHSFTFDKPEDGFWPDEEVWVFYARSNLRIVEIEGVPSIDPQQTSLPENWRGYPAYHMAAGSTMKFKEIKRGDPNPAPDQLTLQRDIWLRFDGSGYAIQDRISGEKNNDWRLEMNPPLTLGRVSVDGMEQFITMRDDTDRAGVELRKGRIQLTADIEYSGSISKLPLTGWDHDFQKVNGKLFLPPGYRILHAAGIDNIPVTWLTRWTLLDLFIVLIVSIAVARLYSRKLAAVAFVMLVLIYHEPGAPRLIWLAILVGTALLRYLPDGKFKKVVKIYQGCIAVLLIAMIVPFVIKELRVGIYPQLEKPWKAMAVSYPLRQAAPSALPAEEPQAMGETDAVKKSRSFGLADLEEKTASSIKGKLRSERSYYRSRKQVAQYDPSVSNQTGPGLPAWKWNTVYLNSGPVQRGQQIVLTLTGPGTNLVLSFVRVALLILFALGIFGVRYKTGGGLQFPDLKAVLLIPFLISLLFMPHISSADEIPSPAMFEELQKRLLEKDDCFPACADISEMNINITPDDLDITMNVDSQVDVNVPVAGSPRHWLPKEIFIDNKKAEALFKTDSGLWVLMPAGRHELVLKGKLPKYNTIQLPLPLKPHRINISQKGWTSEGVHQDGRIDNQIQFKRITEEDSLSNQVLDTGVLPPFALVERRLLLGLVWKIENRVERIGPQGSAIVLDIPLLEGESVITEGIQVSNGKAQINLDARTGQIQWESVMDRADEIVLRHAETGMWTEIWQVDVSPVFHMEYEGIPVVMHKHGNRWNPQWHPWPGEVVRLGISRPAGIEGQTITVDKSHLEVRPGQRATDCKLTLSVRSSQGGQHTIILPENVQLQEVRIGGKIQSIRQEGRNVPLPITPGLQKIVLQWRGQEGMSTNFETPEVNLGLQNANANIDVYLPHNRWPLYLLGPRLGPAILFWSVVIVIALAALGLSRTELTPLECRHWFLLGIGMSQSNMAFTLLVAGWLVALHLRKKARPDMDKKVFNLMQTGIVILTVFAMGALIYSISRGLLGHPDMNIMGNGSGSGLLRWYQDYSSEELPRARVFSIPMINYRLAMLAWALWISFYLISILKWGWKNFTDPTIWHSIPKKIKPSKKDRKDDPKGKTEANDQ